MKAEEMVKGRWYERTDLTSYEHKDKTYLTHIRYNRYINGDINPIRYDECLYGGSLYEKINGECNDVNDFKEVSIEEIQQYLPEDHVDKLVKIPEKWFIRTNKDTEPIVTEYMEKVHGISFNNYHLGKGWGFTNSAEVDKCLIHYNSKSPAGYTEISFEFFKNNILKSSKNMNTKQNFSISGSLALKKAFVEEVGLLTLSQNSVNTNLTAWDSGKGLQGGTLVPSSDTVLFNLPEDWDKALEYVKEYFKEESKFKVGDYVVIINPINSCNSAGEIGIITELTSHDCRVVVDKTRKTNNWVFLSGIRLATSVEIKSVQTKTITIGDKRILFTISKGKIVADGTEFSVEDWKHIRNIMDPDIKLHKYSVILPTIKIGCTTITLDEVNLIIDTYNKINN